MLQFLPAMQDKLGLDILMNPSTDIRKPQAILPKDDPQATTPRDSVL
jgi:hypothetical protein